MGCELRPAPLFTCTNKNHSPQLIKMAYATKKRNGLYYFKAYDLSRWTLATHFFDLCHFYQKQFDGVPVDYRLVLPFGHPLLKADGRDPELIAKIIETFPPKRCKITCPIAPFGGNVLEFSVVTSLEYSEKASQIIHIFNHSTLCNLQMYPNTSK